MIYVFDASAIIAYLDNESGADLVESLLIDNENTCYIHSINLCEVYYAYVRIKNEKFAKELIANLKQQTGLLERQDIDTDFWQSVGTLKARGRLSLADCFCVTLAKKLGAELITSDRKELEPLVRLSVCRIRFIR